MSEDAVRARRKRVVAGGAAAAVVVAMLSLGQGCGAAPKAKSSRLSASDIVETAATIRDSLGESAFLTGRDASSAPVKLGLVEAVNKSQDRLAAADRWALTALVLYDRSVQKLFEERNVHLYIPEDTEATLGKMGLAPGGRLDPALAVERTAPTHVLRAEIRSIARQGAAASSISDERYDVYVIDYRITSFSGSDVVWAKTVQVAREAGGTVAD